VVKNVKDFFEGPINLDLMLLALVKNMNLHQGNIPTKQDISKLGRAFLFNLVYST